MSRTVRHYKGKTYPEKKRKKWKDKKHFGETDGNHTDKHYVLYSIRLQDGEIIQDFETRPPIKCKDFIKYGYPAPLYPKHIVKAKKKGYEQKYTEGL